MPNPISIANRGQEVSFTDYWDSDQAHAGLAFLTWNAGAARLLIPPSIESSLPDILAADHAIITFGKWRAQHDRDTFELMFEDYSDSPFCLFVVAEQSDRRLPKSEEGTTFPILILTADGLQGRLPAHYRCGRIPCLRPL